MNLVIFDLETGGLDLHHPIIQIAAVAVNEQFVEVGHYEAKLAFDPSKCDPQALQMNCYNEATWKAEQIPPITAVLGLNEFLKKHSALEFKSKAGTHYKVARGAAYNAPFDAPRLQALFREHGKFLAMSPQVMCIMQLAMWAEFDMKNDTLPSYKLSQVCERFWIEAEGAHDALADCRLAAEVLRDLKGGKK